MHPGVPSRTGRPLEPTGSRCDAGRPSKETSLCGLGLPGNQGGGHQRGVCLGWFDANHSSSMCFACFQLLGGIARYSFSSDAQSIFVPEGVAGAAPVGGIRSHIGELVP